MKRTSTTFPLHGKVDQRALRRALIDTCRAMNASGINQGTSGNASARLAPDRFVITPSGRAYDTMKPADLPVMAIDGRWAGTYRPSSEWRFHRDIFAARPDVGAIVHAHSSFATALACLRLDVPAFHYMVAVGGGDSIRCAPYATFGTQELSDRALAALEGRKACLLANHGLIATGATPHKALALAIEVETLCGMYLRARAVSEPVRLSANEMARVIELFRTYGTPEFPDTQLHRVKSLAPRRR
jgi:L-fuculose-phosphate aldolase